MVGKDFTAVRRNAIRSGAVVECMLVLATAFLSETVREDVTFESPSTRLERLLPELAKVVGTPLRPSAALRDERLIVGWHQRPAAELLKEVAQVCSAQWERDAEGLKLVRPVSTDQALARAAFDLRVTAIKKGLAEQKPLKPFDAPSLAKAVDAWYRGERSQDQLDNDRFVSQDEARRALFAMGPGGRAARRAATLLAPERYADLVDDDRRIFSSRPTARQARLGPEFIQVLKEFCEEHDRMVAASPATRRQQTWAGDPTDDLRRYVPSQLTLEIEAITYWGMRPYQLNVTVKGTWKGHPIVAAQQEIVGLDEKARPPVVDPRPYTMLIPPKRAEALVLVRRPDEHEPLADSLMDLPRLAALRKRDLVARVDDEMGSQAAWLRGEKSMTVGRALSGLLGNAHTLHEDGQTLLVAPIDEPWHRRNDCNRQDLRALVAATERDGYTSLETAAAFAQRNGKAAFQGLAGRFVDLLCPGSGEAFRRLDIASLRLFGALSPAHRKAILAGGRVPLMDAGTAVRSQAERIVFEMRSRFDMDEDVIDQASTSAPSELDRMPAKAYLTGEETLQPVMASIYTSAGRDFRHVLDAANLGVRLGIAQANGNAYDPATVYQRVVPGERRRITLRIVLNSKSEETLVLKEDRFSAKSKPGSYDALPASFRKAAQIRAEAQVEAMRKFYGTARPAKP